jgi:hypothetical protein
MYALRLIKDAGYEVCGAASLGGTAVRQLAALTFVSVRPGHRMAVGPSGDDRYLVGQARGGTLFLSCSSSLREDLLKIASRRPGNRSRSRTG